MQTIVTESLLEVKFVNYHARGVLISEKSEKKMHAHLQKVAFSHFYNDLKFHTGY